jgi:predicted metal-binding membrane protein
VTNLPAQSAGSALRTNTLVLTSVLAAALVAWAVAVEQMQGMDAGPGTDLGSFVWFVGIWLTMTIAMMLPSAAPTTLMFSRLGRASQTALFVVGYLLAWMAFGIAAYIVGRLAREAAPSFVAWDQRGPWVAGAALIAAGVYQLTPLKTACLHHCRSPLHFLLHRRRGGLGAVRVGLGHGGYCIGCCAGLMLALFALGIMSVFWMAVAAVAILAEKLLPGGEVFARVLAVALVVLGAWVAVSPQSTPGLHQPDQMHMPMQMGTTQ